MKAETNRSVGSMLMRVTGIALGLQLVLGGLVTFNFISPEFHIIVGFSLFVLAVAAMIFALLSRPPFRPLQLISIAIVVLLVLEIALGFATLESGNQVIAFVHFVNAMAIFGVSASGSFMAMRWVQLSRQSQAVDTAIEYSSTRLSKQ